MSITNDVASRLAGTASNVYTCGVCGCLCRFDEACPKCRGDLIHPLARR